METKEMTVGTASAIAATSAASIAAASSEAGQTDAPADLMSAVTQDRYGDANVLGVAQISLPEVAHLETHTPRSKPSGAARWEGRAFGGIVLAAFLLYGIGSASAHQPIGMTLVVLNSVAVTIAGVIGFRLLRSNERIVGLGYLAARVAEAGLLAGGIVLAEVGDVTDADTTGYLLGMVALSAGSVPFMRALGRRRWIAHPLAIWGTFGYTALAVGALLELMTGRSLAVIFAIPGGLFELALGIYLLRRGFALVRSGAASDERRVSRHELT